MPRWLLGIPGNEPIPASEEVGRAASSAELRTWTYPHELTIVRDDGRVFVWNAASVAVDDGTEDSLAVAINNGGVGRYVFASASFAVFLSNGSTVAASRIVNAEASMSAGSLLLSRTPNPILERYSQTPAPPLPSNGLTVWLPLRPEDRYSDATDSNKIKTRNYGSAGGGAVLGDGTVSHTLEQLPYTPGNYGLRAPALYTGIADTLSVLWLPAAWINTSTGYALVIYYVSRPLANYQYLCHVGINDTISPTTVRQSNTNLWGITGDTGVTLAQTMHCAVPNVMIITAAAGSATAQVYINGALVGTTLYNQGTYAATHNHIIGGKLATLAPDTGLSYGGVEILGVAAYNHQVTLTGATVGDANEVAQITAHYRGSRLIPTVEISGQSNAVNPGTSSEIPSVALLRGVQRIAYFDGPIRAFGKWAEVGVTGLTPDNYWGPIRDIEQDRTFGIEQGLAWSLLSKAPFLILKWSVSGYLLSNWTAVTGVGRSVWDSLLEGICSIPYGLVPDVKALIFDQGEAEAVAGGAGYAAKMVTFAAMMRAVSRNATLPIVTSTISTLITPATVPDRATVNSEKTSWEAADVAGTLINGDAFALKTQPNVHRSSQGVWDAGVAYAAAIASLMP